MHEYVVMAEEKKVTPQGNVEAPARVNFDYIKGQDFRVIHVDGAIGSVTLNGHVHMALYSERPPIPRRTVFGVKDGKLGEEILPERIARDAIVRELDIDLMMTIDVAESICKWLERKVEEAKQEDYIQRFYRLLDKWRAETLHSSFFQQKIEHPSFRQIVEIGRPTIPLILDDLRVTPSFLFFALQLITGDNPVPPHLRGNVRAAVDMWIEWGNRQGIV